jgi:hypothetical protein
MNNKHESKNNKLISKAHIEEYEKKLYDYGQLVEVAKSLCSVLEFSTLIESNLYTCMCQMRVLGAGMFVLKSFDSDCFTLENNYSGFDPDMEIEYTIPTTHPIISYLCETNQAYTIDELEANLEKDGLLKHLMSTSIVNTDNRYLKTILDFVENSLVFVLKYVDVLKNFKNPYWRNR